jgi:hypothetical protein
VYLRVRPDSLDHAGSGLAALATSVPPAHLILRDLEAVGACLPGFAAGQSGIAGTGDGRWAQSVAAVRTALLRHAEDLGRSAQGYRDVDAGLSR